MYWKFDRNHGCLKQEISTNQFSLFLFFHDILVILISITEQRYWSIFQITALHDALYYACL